MMRVLGIDPGSNCTGFGIVEETRGRLEAVAWGGIRSKPKMSFPDRLKLIYDELICQIREHEPNVAAVEDLFFATNVKSVLKLGQTRGVTLLAAAHCDLEIAEYSPLEVKQSTVGYGRADKGQVSKMVTALLHLNKAPEPHDATDALAVAICHIHNAKTKSRLQAHLK